MTDSSTEPLQNQRTESRFEALLDQAADHILFVDLNGKIRYINRIVRPLKMNEVIGTSMFDWIAPEQVEQQRAGLKHVIETGETITFETKSIGDDNTEAWYTSKLGPVFRDGQVVEVICIGQNMTKQRQTHQELVESKERIDLAVRSTDLGLWDWNVATGHAYFNDQWANMLGYALSDIEPHVNSWGDLLHPDDQPRTYKNLMDHHEGRSPTFESQLRMKTKDGGWKWIHTNGRVVDRDGTGKPLRMIGTHREIDEVKRAEIAMRESEAKWRSITEHSPDYIMTLDVEGKIQFINRTVPGLESKGVLGHHVNDFVPEQFHSKTRACFDRVIATGKSDSYEVDHIAPDDSVHHFEARVGPLLNAEGRVVGFTVSSSDVTERVRDREKLRFTQFAVDSSFDAAYWIRPDASFAYINTAAYETLGYTHGELMVLTIPDISKNSTPQTWAAHFSEVKEVGSVVLETEHRTKEGLFVPVEITAGYLEYGNREYICAFARDITERKQAEQTLREQGELLSKVVESVPHSVFWKDRASIYLGCNSRFARESGVHSPSQIIGKTDFDLAWKHEEAEFFRQCDQQVMSENQSMINIEEPQLQADGAEATLLTSKVPLRDEAGNVIGILGIYTDITERKQFEQVLVDYQNQLRSLAAQVAQAEQAERRRIATGLHDQIGQLLAIAKIKLDGLRKRAEGDTKKRADEIVELMNQAILDTRNLTFELCPPALYELGVEAALEELGQQFEQRHNVRVRFGDDGRDKPLPEEVRGLLFEATRELLRNAIRHAKATVIDLRVERDGDQALIMVQDNGIGFPTTDGREMERQGGGFGLFNIRERLTRFGGFMSIESGAGKGCCVRLTIPLMLESSRKIREDPS
jgi:PAS domain S-box-containing protein